MFTTKTTKIRLALFFLVIYSLISLDSAFVYGDGHRVVTPESEETNDGISGWFWQLMDQINKSWKIDRLAYWMPLTQGNTKTFKYSVPNIEDIFEYTKTVQGTEIIKGVGIVKIRTNEISYINQTYDESIINKVFEGGISELSSAIIDGVDYP